MTIIPVQLTSPDPELQLLLAHPELQQPCTPEQQQISMPEQQPPEPGELL